MYTLRGTNISPFQVDFESSLFSRFLPLRWVPCIRSRLEAKSTHPTPKETKKWQKIHSSQTLLTSQVAATFSWSCTWELSPPQCASPQVTTFTKSRGRRGPPGPCVHIFFWFGNPWYWPFWIGFMIIKFQKLVLMLYVSIEYFVLIFSCYLLSRTPFQKPFGSSEKPRSCPTVFQETC